MTKIKICGLKYPHNINQLIEVKPDYLGFIFYPNSPRYCEGFFEAEFMEQIPASIKKVGIFVNESASEIKKVAKKYSLDAIQLHGHESPETCSELKREGKIVIKAFQVDQNFIFHQIAKYKPFTDFFLFDTRNPMYGGSGKTFDWELLQKYDNEKPFFLSGGIDITHAYKLKEINNLNIHAVDINSKFETSPGMKDLKTVTEFINIIRQ